MSLDMYGEYGPGRDFSNDPPIIYEGCVDIPPGWLHRLELEEDEDGESRGLKQPEPDDNVTEEWLTAQKASAEAIERSRAHSRALWLGQIEPEPYDFGDILSRIALDEEEKPRKKSAAKRSDRPTSKAAR